MSIATNNNRIRIFSKEMQDYLVTDFQGDIEDDNGVSMLMKCIDKNGKICRVRFRRQFYPETLQFYIEYNDVKWVYNVNKM